MTEATAETHKQQTPTYNYNQDRVYWAGTPRLSSRPAQPAAKPATPAAGKLLHPQLWGERYPAWRSAFTLPADCWAGLSRGQGSWPN